MEFTVGVFSLGESRGVWEELLYLVHSLEVLVFILLGIPPRAWPRQRRQQAAAQLPSSLVSCINKLARMS